MKTIKEEFLPYIKEFFTNIKTKEIIIKLNRNFKHIDKDLIKHTNPNYPLKARIQLAILGEYQKNCKNTHCSNIVKFDEYKNNFRTFCSVKCRNQNSELRKKISNKWKNKQLKQIEINKKY